MKTNNILVIDDGLSNSEKSVNSGSSISYKKSMVDNDYCYKPDLSDFLDIFKNEHPSITSINTVNAITLIDKSGNEYSMHEYRDNIKIVFFKVTDSVLKRHDSEILINAKSGTFGHQLANNHVFSWSTFYKLYGKASEEINVNSPDSNGYEICRQIKTVKGTLPVFIGKCGNSVFRYGNIRYEGYMPSVYQMMTIYKCMNVINYFITDIMHMPVSDTYCHSSHGTFWTCNEYDEDYAYMINGSEDSWDGTPECALGRKHEWASIFPIYKPVEII